MATDFWASSHYKRWLVDRKTIIRARAVDLEHLDGHNQEYFSFFAIYFADAIVKLGRKLGVRQRVIATATVFFRRFYLKNSYCETDPFLVIAACCYVAAKAEECPVSIKIVATEARNLFNQETYSLKPTHYDHSQIAEMEFYLVDDLECDLTIFHPYRTLTALCKPDPPSVPTSTGGAMARGNSQGSLFELEEGEAEEPGVGIGSDDGPRYWGTGDGQLELPEGGFQHAWLIINDTYRSNLCLLYPPHLIAIAALYLTVILHSPSRAAISPHIGGGSTSTPTANTPSSTPTSTTPRRSTRHAQPTSPAKKPPDTIIAFLSEMNVSLPLVATIAQEIISLWSLWDRYKEETSTETGAPPTTFPPGVGLGPLGGSPIKHAQRRSVAMASSSSLDGVMSTSMLYSGERGNVPSQFQLPDVNNNDGPVVVQTRSGATLNVNQMGDTMIPPKDMTVSGGDGQQVITATFLTGLLVKMRERRIAALAQRQQQEQQGGIGGAGAVGRNKMLERAQNAG